MSSDSTNILTVIFRPTSVEYKVKVNETSTVQEIILDVCRQANCAQANNCFLWFKSEQLSSDDTLGKTSLYPIPTTTDYPEVRFKFLHQLVQSPPIEKHVIPASTKQIDYREPLDASSQYSLDSTESLLLYLIAKQISVNTLSNKTGLTLIPLPVFSKQSIDYLPTMYMTLTDLPIEFEWKLFLECLVDDLAIEQRDIIVVDILDNPTILKAKFTTKILQNKQYLQKMSKILSSNILPRTEQFINEYSVSSDKEINIELENFNIEQEDTIVTPDYIDLALRLSDRTAVIDSLLYEFLTKKSRQITTCLLNSFQQSSIEYIFDHIDIIYHNNSFNNSVKHDKILFYGTHITNFDNIFENFSFLSQTKQIEDGQYGRGYYFYSSPRQAIKRVNFIPRSTIYLLCANVKLGNTLRITTNFKNEDIQSNYDSHVIPIDENGKLISPEQKPISNEYVIKRDDQILPFYIIGLRPIQRFIIWRDAKIMNNDNKEIFEKLKQRYDFNLYGCQSNIEVFNILNKKLIDHTMKCVVITNGDDGGDQFVRKCRELRPDLSIVVFCTNIAYHQSWAEAVGEPKIKVTNDINEMITFVDHTFTEHL